MTTRSSPRSQWPETTQQELGDAMTETPKPPTGYTTWLDYHCSMDAGAFVLVKGVAEPLSCEWAKAELAALREDRDSLLMAAEDALCEADSLRAERDAWKALSIRTQAALAELVRAVRLHPADVGHDAALHSAIAALRPEDKP
jgi:hypothetical protein